MQLLHVPQALVDPNILARQDQPRHPHLPIYDRVAIVERIGEESLYITTNLIEMHREVAALRDATIHGLRRAVALRRKVREGAKVRGAVDGPYDVAVECVVGVGAHGVL